MVKKMREYLSKILFEIICQKIVGIFLFGWYICKSYFFVCLKKCCIKTMLYVQKL
jgi:hypothetical protein